MSSEKRIIAKWIESATDRNLKDHLKHFYFVGDKMLGLNPDYEKLKAAYEFIDKKIAEGEDKHQILNYLLGVMKI